VSGTKSQADIPTNSLTPAPAPTSVPVANSVDICMSSADTCTLFFLLIPPISSFPFAINSGTRTACSSSFVLLSFTAKPQFPPPRYVPPQLRSASLPLRLALRHHFLFRRLRSSPAKFHRRELCCPTVSVVRFLVFRVATLLPFLVQSAFPSPCAAQLTVGTLPSLSCLPFVVPCVWKFPLETLNSFQPPASKASP
jgi:hypothetical protein